MQEIESFVSPRRQRGKTRINDLLDNGLNKLKGLQILMNIKLLLQETMNVSNKIAYLKVKLREDIQKNGIKSEIGIIYLIPLPPYLESEKQKNEILVCLRPPLHPAKSEKFGRF